MSIFPKRTRRGTHVTIHWNFNTSRLTQTHLMPYVRIGVRAPDGHLTMLHEGHVLCLPGPAAAPDTPEAVGQQLPKSVPLLVLASYLSGRRHQREELVEMLRGIHSGRHYYFTYALAADAPLGRYTLLSEVYTDGRLQHSGTAADDFFLVEELQLGAGEALPGGGWRTIITNPGPEPVPLRLVEYEPQPPGSVTSRVHEVPALGTLPVETLAAQSFVLYNEEREVLPVPPRSAPVFLRNQQLLSLEKGAAGPAVTYVLAGEGEEAYELTGPSREVWHLADGLCTPHHLPDAATRQAYQELLAEGLLTELPG